MNLPIDLQQTTSGANFLLYSSTSNLIQYILANQNRTVPLRKNIVRISEIALFPLTINTLIFMMVKYCVICCLSSFNYFEIMKALEKLLTLLTLGNMSIFWLLFEVVF